MPLQRTWEISNLQTRYTCTCTCIVHVYRPYNYDRSDTVATIYFSMQFGVATIREQRLFCFAPAQMRL